jgi:hypothetical protein
LRLRHDIPALVVFEVRIRGFDGRRALHKLQPALTRNQKKEKRKKK